MIIAPEPDGVRIHADPSVAAFLQRLPELFDRIDPQEPAAERLRVPVYPDDSEANEEWWHYMSDELETGRAQDRSVFRSTMREAADGAFLGREEAHAVARVTGELRLVVAARVGIETEDDYDGLDDADRSLLDALGAIQMGVLRALEHPGVSE